MADLWWWPPSLLPTKALQVPGHLRAEWQVTRIEAFDLFDAGAGVLGEVEDVDLALAQDDAHTDGGVAQ